MIIAEQTKLMYYVSVFERQIGTRGKPYDSICYQTRDAHKSLQASDSGSSLFRAPQSWMAARKRVQQKMMMILPALTKSSSSVVTGEIGLKIYLVTFLTCFRVVVIDARQFSNTLKKKCHRWHLEKGAKDHLRLERRNVSCLSYIPSYQKKSSAQARKCLIQCSLILLNCTGQPSTTAKSIATQKWSINVSVRFSGSAGHFSANFIPF